MNGFRILPEVAEDIAEAANWYDEKGYPSLGERFIDTFYSYVAHIVESGEIHRVVYSDFRRSSVAVPVFSFYRCDGDLPVIVLVIGAMRKPSLIRREQNPTEISPRLSAMAVTRRKTKKHSPSAPAGSHFPGSSTPRRESEPPPHLSTLVRIVAGKRSAAVGTLGQYSIFKSFLLTPFSFPLTRFLSR